MPQGTMPVLEIDKKIKFSQSTTIARHLAREFSKYTRITSFTRCSFNCADPERRQDIRTPVKKYKAIGVLSNTVPDSLKKSHSYQANIECWAIVATPVKRQFKGGFAGGPMMTHFRWFLHLLSHLINLNKTLSDLDLLFLDPRMLYSCKEQNLLQIHGTMGSVAVETKFNAGNKSAKYCLDCLSNNLIR